MYLCTAVSVHICCAVRVSIHLYATCLLSHWKYYHISRSSFDRVSLYYLLLIMRLWANQIFVLYKEKNHKGKLSNSPLSFVAKALLFPLRVVEPLAEHNHVIFSVMILSSIGTTDNVFERHLFTQVLKLLPSVKDISAKSKHCVTCLHGVFLLWIVVHYISTVWNWLIKHTSVTQTCNAILS